MTTTKSPDSSSNPAIHMNELIHELDGHLLARKRPDKELVAALLLSLERNASDLEAHWHSLGFVNLTFASLPDGSLRFHCWPAFTQSQCEQQWRVHDHVYRLRSVLVVGELQNLTYSVTKDSAGEHQLYEVEYATDLSRLRATGERVRASVTTEDRLQKGDVYDIPAGEFHQSRRLEGALSSTLMRTFAPKRPTARVVGGRSGPPVIERPLLQCPTDVLARCLADTRSSI